MKYSFLWPALGLTMGIVLDDFFDLSPAILFLTLTAGIVILWFLQSRKLFLPFFVFFMAVGGMLHNSLSLRSLPHAIENFVPSQPTVSSRLPAGQARLRGSIRTPRLAVIGTVHSLPEMKVYGKKRTLSFIFKPGRLIRWKNGKRQSVVVSGLLQTFLIQPPFVPEVGDELRLYGALEVPRRISNPGEFDYGRYLKDKSIHAIFQCIGKRSVQRLRAGHRFLPERLLAQTRSLLASYIERLYSPQDAAILKALVLGIRTQISPEIRDHFMKTGTIHILAISGLNITMIAGSFFLLFLVFGMDYRKASWVTMAIVLTYIGLAGAGLPVQRAGYTSMLVLLAVLAGRPANSLNILCFAFFVMLLWDPKNFWNLGFQLSFLSVFSLIVIQPLMTRLSVYGIALGSSCAVLLGTFPLVLYYFNIFSPVSLIANLLAMPLFDAALFLTLFSLLLSWVPIINMILIKLVSFFLATALLWIEWLSHWRAGYEFVIRPLLWQMLGYYGALAGIVLLRKFSFPGRKPLMLGLFMALGVAGFSFFWPGGSAKFQMTILSSGKNQIAHIRFSGMNHWLMNTGRGYPSDQGEWLVVPHLRQCGINDLEGILISDFSRNNTGGLQSILRDFPIDYLLYGKNNPVIPKDLSNLFQHLHSRIQGVQTGDAVRGDGDAIKIVAANRKGMVLHVKSGPWHIVVLSCLDPALLRLLERWDHHLEIHAMWLPHFSGRIPPELVSWMVRQKPLLAISSDFPKGTRKFLSVRGIRTLSLKETGALVLAEKQDTLELKSYLRGKLGFYSYS